MHTFFLAMTLGLPIGMVIVAFVAAHFHGEDCTDVLDWKPTRSPEREAELQLDDVDQMLAAQNRYRRERGAPERTLEEVTEQAWARLRLDRPLWWPKRS